MCILDSTGFKNKMQSYKKKLMNKLFTSSKLINNDQRTVISIFYYVIDFFHLKIFKLLGQICHLNTSLTECF